MSCFIYVNFGKCKLDLAKISLSLAKMVESGGVRSSKGVGFIIILIEMKFQGIHVSKLIKVMCLNVCQKYTKLFGGKIPIH